MPNPPISVVTPTTGKDGLFKLIDSLRAQSVPYVHIILTDDKREGKFLYPDPQTMFPMFPNDLNSSDLKGVDGSCRYNITIPGSFVQGRAYGSALRSVGMMAANTPYITFADDDVWLEKSHLETLLKAVEKKEWAFSRRKVWKNTENGLQYLGIDNFESVGNSPDRKVPYEMVDNNCMIFSRRFGSSGAVLYRETCEYNDDRLLYAFLKQYAGEPGKTGLATVNQICPKKLETMFEQLCTKE